jgi:hypothetical protein
MDKIPLTSAQLPERSKLSSDLIAGLTFAMVNVLQAIGNGEPGAGYCSSAGKAWLSNRTWNRR